MEEREPAAPARRRAARHQEVEPAVVVVVERLGRRRARRTQRAQRAVGAPLAGEATSAPVEPERRLDAARAAHEDVEEPVVVEVPERHRARGAGARHPAPRRRVTEALRPAVVEELVAPRLARDEEVDAPVAVEVAEGGVAGRTAAGEPEGGRRVAEGAVEVVAVHGGRPLPHEQEVQVAVVVEVREERPARAPHLADPRPRRDLLEGEVPPVAEEVGAALGAEDEEVEPAVVVVVGERRGEGVGGERETRPLGDVEHLATPEPVQAHDRRPTVGRWVRDEEVDDAVPVDVARGERGRSGRRGLRRTGRGGGGRRRGKDVARDVREPHRIRGVVLPQRPEGEVVLRYEGQHRTPHQRSLRPPHLVERGLVRRGELHLPHEPVEGGLRRRHAPAAQEPERALQ